MTDAPITLTLDLWAEGYSASQIAEMVGHPSHKAVARIVANARNVGDKRAVYHRQGWRLHGRGIPANDRDINPLQKTYRGFRIVPVVANPPLKLCKRGHERTGPGECRACKKITDRLRYSAIKGHP